MKTRTMGTHAWAFHEERISALPDFIRDIGVGENAVQTTGLTSRQIAESLMEIREEMIDGGANVLGLNLDDGSLIHLYVRRRGKSYDVGTRIDFRALGWDNICDVLDNQIRNL